MINLILKYFCNNNLGLIVNNRTSFQSSLITKKKKAKAWSLGFHFKFQHMGSQSRKIVGEKITKITTTTTKTYSKSILPHYTKRNRSGGGVGRKVNGGKKSGTKGRKSKQGKISFLHTKE